MFCISRCNLKIVISIVIFTFYIIKLICIIIWAPSSEFVSSSIPSWQILTAHAQPFRGTRDMAFCLKVPLDSLLIWASSEDSGETSRMRRLAWTFAARIGDKYQIRLTRPIKYPTRLVFRVFSNIYILNAFTEKPHSKLMACNVVYNPVTTSKSCDITWSVTDVRIYHCTL